MAKKRTEEVSVSPEQLKEAGNSSVWKDIIKPYLEEEFQTVSDLQVTIPFEKDCDLGTALIARRIAGAFLQKTINEIDVIDNKITKDDTEQLLDTFE